ncbi:hypothetical protein MTO96_039320 [Rhipicephalus appendiculatus]
MASQRNIGTPAQRVPGTRTVPDADAVAASAGSTPSTSTQLTTTSPEDSMEDEDNEPSEWDTVNYRRYTTRRLKGELRSERPRIENQHEQQKTPRTLDRESAVMTDRALDTIMQLLEKLNSRMEAIERAMAQQEQVIMQHKEVNEQEIAQIKATADECKRNYRRARNRSRE